MLTVLWAVCAVAGVLLVALILVHKGSGDGLTDMFGGGGGGVASRTASAGRNLTLFTVAVAAVWVASIVGIGLLDR